MKWNIQNVLALVFAKFLILGVLYVLISGAMNNPSDVASARKEQSVPKPKNVEEKSKAKEPPALLDRVPSFTEAKPKEAPVAPPKAKAPDPAPAAAPKADPPVKKEEPAAEKSAATDGAEKGQKDKTRLEKEAERKPRTVVPTQRIIINGE